MKTPRNRRYFGVLLSLALSVTVFLAIPIEAQAYTFEYCNGEPVQWSSGNIPAYRFSEISFPSGSTHRNDANTMLSRWGSGIGGNSVSISTTTNTQSVGANNGHNQIWAAGAQRFDDAHAVAVIRSTPCFWIFGSSEHVETSIIFNAGSSWHIGEPDCHQHLAEEGEMTIQEVMIHEIGHTLGIHHEIQRPAVMSPNGYGRLHGCSGWKTQANPDDAKASRILYPNPDQEMKNLSASAFEWFGLNLALYSDPVDTLYVCPRDQFQTRWTAANNGTEDLEFNVGFYISAVSPYIFGAPIGENFGAFQSAESLPGTFSRYLTVPDWVEYGDVYYVITLLDHDDQHDQWVQNDNLSYSTQKIQIHEEHLCE
jgi:hypothetical protein